jgi:hypothetical protein
MEGVKNASLPNKKRPFSLHGIYAEKWLDKGIVVDL